MIASRPRPLPLYSDHHRGRQITRRSRFAVAAVLVGVATGAGIMFGVLTLLDDDEAQPEEGRIQAAVEQLYDLISAESYEAVWNMYTSGFRERCSLEVMIRHFENLRIEGVHDRRVTGFDDINFVGDRAWVSYSVVGFDDTGRQTANYEYDTVLYRENDRWLLDEGCFPP